MATITLTITVEDIDATIALFDKLKIYRSTAGVGGPFVELTTVPTRPDLVAGQSVYEYVDGAGDPAYFYKTSYFNSVSSSESSLSDAIQGNVDPLIIDVDDLRNEGLTISAGSPEEDRALELIKTFQSWVEQLTGTWFIPRQITLELDGRGTKLLQLSQPIISVTNLWINGEFATASALVDGTDFVAYTRRGGEEGRDDRRNPRIKLISDDTSVFSGTGPLRRRTSIFEIGEQNQRIEGTFGFVDPDGCVPPPLKYALKKLVIRAWPKLGLGGGGGGGFPGGPIIEEETDRHRRKYADPFAGTKLHSKTGDLEVDMILSGFKRPLVVRGPRTLFGRNRARGSLP
jgi:hypothetical protein